MSHRLQVANKAVRGRSDVLDSLTFGVVLAILTAWVFAWGLIAAVVATSKQQDPIGGLVQGLTLGPVGVLFVALSSRANSQLERGRVSEASNLSSDNGSRQNSPNSNELYK
jgi:hypothetical protein